MEEIWKNIEQLGIEYQVSNMGRVRKMINEEYKYLKPVLTYNGYERIFITIKGKHYRLRVHRLVAEAFIPNTLNKPQINHIDGNKRNNRVDNLEWVTCKENMQHAQKIGLMPTAKPKTKQPKKVRIKVIKLKPFKPKQSIYKPQKIKHIAKPSYSIIDCNVKINLKEYKQFNNILIISNITNKVVRSYNSLLEATRKTIGSMFCNPYYYLYKMSDKKKSKLSYRWVLI